jgi:hypothetical protein
MEFVSLYAIIEAVGRYPFKRMPNVNLEEYKEWAFECIARIGVVTTEAQKTVLLPVENGEVVLPKELKRIYEVRDGYSLTPMNDVGNANMRPDTYKHFNGRLYLPYDTGRVSLTYSTYLTDENGTVMIPDIHEYRKAVELYLLERVAFKGLIMEVIQPGLYAELKRDANRQIYAAREASRELTPDKLAELSNVMFRGYIDPIRRKHH